MKPFLGIDITENKKNEDANGKEFIIAKPAEALTRSLDDTTEKAEEVIKRAALPLPLRIIEYICGFFFAVFVLGVLRSDVSITEAYKNASVFFWIAGCAGIVFGILWLIGNRRSKAVAEEDQTVNTLHHLEGIANAIYTDLGVPDSAIEIDVLSFFYKDKSGMIKLHRNGLPFTHLNLEFMAYSDEQSLYLVSLHEKYAFPLSDIKAIRTVKERISLMGWNKDLSIKSATYKPYKLVVDKYDNVLCKYYHIVEINRNGDTFGIYIPCYELPVFEKLTSLKAQDE